MGCWNPHCPAGHVGTLMPGLQGILWDLGQSSPGRGRSLLPEDHREERPFPRQCRHGLPLAEGRVGVETHFRAWHRCRTQQAPSSGGGSVAVRSAFWPGGLPGCPLTVLPTEGTDAFGAKSQGLLGEAALASPTFHQHPLLRTKGFPHSEPLWCQVPYCFFFSRLNAYLNS